MSRGGGDKEMATQAKYAAVDGLHTFPRLLFHHAAVRPNAPAMREKYLGIWQTWTWADVADRVRALACGLASLGFKRGDNLAIIGGTFLVDIDTCL
jgi:long-chain acyl-CoA synthetase